VLDDLFKVASARFSREVPSCTAFATISLEAW
jgi:hypothetical protein